MEKTLLCSKWKSQFIFVSSMLFVFYVMSQIAITNSLSNYLITKFSLNTIQFSQASSVYLYACVMSVIPAGYLLDRFGFGYPVLISAFFSVAGALLFLIATDYKLFLVGRFLSGLGNNIAFFAPLRLASLIFAIDKQATVKGFIFAAAMLGGLVTQAPLILLSKHVSIETILFSNVILGLLIFTLLSFCFHKPNCIKQTKQLNMGYSHISLMASLNILLKKRQVWLCAFYAGLVNLVFIILGTLWGNLYLTQIQHFSSNTASVITGFIFLGIILGSTLLGWLSQLFKTRLALMQLCAIIATTSTLLLTGNTHSFLSISVLFFLLGFANSAQFFGYVIIAETCNSNQESTAASFISFIINMVGILFQILFAWLIYWQWDGALKNNAPWYTAQTFHTAFLVMALLFYLAAFLPFFMRKNKQN